jgi:predicted transcriptional regulator
MPTEKQYHQMQHFYDAIDSAAKKYGVAALAFELGKHERTLRNELTRQENYKLDLSTAVYIMLKTDDYTGLDILNGMMGRTSFVLPEKDPGSAAQVLEIAGRVAKEYGEHIREVGNAVMDGVITDEEADRCVKELEDTMKVLAEMRAFLRRKSGAGNG